MSLGNPSRPRERLVLPRGMGPTWTRRAGVGRELFERDLVTFITPFRSPFVARFFARWFLPAWFAVITLWQITLAVRQGWFGLDARIYYRGAAAWLAGGNPADASANMAASTFPFHYAAWPPMTIITAPFTLLPEQAFVVAWLGVSALAAVYAVRRLKLPLYWLLFPPLVEGTISGNPSIVLLALLVSPSRIAQALAVVLKMYAAIPLAAERRWRALSLAGGLILLSLLAWPLWSTYLADVGTIAARLSFEAGGGLSGSDSGVVLLLGIVGLLVLARIDVRAAGWLVVPALWPSTQFHYSTLAMPVMHPILAMGLALPLPSVPLIVITIYAGWRVLSTRLVPETTDVPAKGLAAHRRPGVPEAA